MLQIEALFLFVFIFMMLSIKVFPLYLLRNTKIHIVSDSIVLGSLFGIYNMHLWANGTNVYEVYDKTIQSFKDGNNNTPLFMLMHQLFLFFKL